MFDRSPSLSSLHVHVPEIEFSPPSNEIYPNQHHKDSTSSIAFLGKKITREYRSAFVLPDENVVAVNHREIFVPNDSIVNVFVSLSLSGPKNEKYLQNDRYKRPESTDKILDHIHDDDWARDMLTGCESRDSQLLGHIGNHSKTSPDRYQFEKNEHSIRNPQKPVPKASPEKSAIDQPTEYTVSIKTKQSAKFGVEDPWTDRQEKITRVYDLDRTITSPNGKRSDNDGIKQNPKSQDNFIANSFNSEINDLPFIDREEEDLPFGLKADNNYEIDRINNKIIRINDKTESIYSKAISKDDQDLDRLILDNKTKVDKSFSKEYFEFDEIYDENQKMLKDSSETQEIYKVLDIKRPEEIGHFSYDNLNDVTISDIDDRSERQIIIKVEPRKAEDIKPKMSLSNEDQTKGEPKSYTFENTSDYYLRPYSRNNQTEYENHISNKFSINIKSISSPDESKEKIEVKTSIDGSGDDPRSEFNKRMSAKYSIDSLRGWSSNSVIKADVDRKTDAYKERTIYPRAYLKTWDRELKRNQSESDLKTDLDPVSIGFRDKSQSEDRISINRTSQEYRSKISTESGHVRNHVDNYDPAMSIKDTNPLPLSTDRNPSVKLIQISDETNTRSRKSESDSWYRSDQETCRFLSSENGITVIEKPFDRHSFERAKIERINSFNKKLDEKFKEEMQDVDTAPTYKKYYSADVKETNSFDRMRSSFERRDSSAKKEVEHYDSASFNGERQKKALNSFRNSYFHESSGEVKKSRSNDLPKVTEAEKINRSSSFRKAVEKDVYEELQPKPVPDEITVKIDPEFERKLVNRNLREKSFNEKVKSKIDNFERRLESQYRQEQLSRSNSLKKLADSLYESQKRATDLKMHIDNKYKPESIVATRNSRVYDHIRGQYAGRTQSMYEEPNIYQNSHDLLNKDDLYVDRNDKLKEISNEFRLTKSVTPQDTFHCDPNPYRAVDLNLRGDDGPDLDVVDDDISEDIDDMVIANKISLQGPVQPNEYSYNFNPDERIKDELEEDLKLTKKQKGFPYNLKRSSKLTPTESNRSIGNDREKSLPLPKIQINFGAINLDSPRDDGLEHIYIESNSNDQIVDPKQGDKGFPQGNDSSTKGLNGDCRYPPYEPNAKLQKGNEKIMIPLANPDPKGSHKEPKDANDPNSHENLKLLENIMNKQKKSLRHVPSDTRPQRIRNDPYKIDYGEDTFVAKEDGKKIRTPIDSNDEKKNNQKKEDEKELRKKATDDDDRRRKKNTELDQSKREKHPPPPKRNSLKNQALPSYLSSNNQNETDLNDFEPPTLSYDPSDPYEKDTRRKVDRTPKETSHQRIDSRKKTDIPISKRPNDQDKQTRPELPEKPERRDPKNTEEKEIWPPKRPERNSSRQPAGKPYPKLYSGISKNPSAETPDYETSRTPIEKAKKPSRIKTDVDSYSPIEETVDEKRKQDLIKKISDTLRPTIDPDFNDKAKTPDDAGMNKIKEPPVIPEKKPAARRYRKSYEPFQDDYPKQKIPDDELAEDKTLEDLKTNDNGLNGSRYKKVSDGKGFQKNKSSRDILTKSNSLDNTRDSGLYDPDSIYEDPNINFSNEFSKENLLPADATLHRHSMSDDLYMNDQNDNIYHSPKIDQNEFIVSTKRRNMPNLSNYKNRPISRSTNNMWFGDHAVPVINKNQPPGSMVKRNSLQNYANNSIYGKSQETLLSTNEPLTYSNIQLQAHAELLRRRRLRTLSVDRKSMSKSNNNSLDNSVMFAGLSEADLKNMIYSPSGKKLKGGAAQYNRNISKRLAHQDGFETYSKIHVPKAKGCNHMNIDNSLHQNMDQDENKYIKDLINFATQV